MKLHEKIIYSISGITIIILLSIVIALTGENKRVEDEIVQLKLRVKQEQDLNIRIGKTIDSIGKSIGKLSGVYTELRQVKQSYEELEQRGARRLERDEKLNEIAGQLNYRLERGVSSAQDIQQRSRDRVIGLKDSASRAEREIEGIFELLEEGGEEE